MKWKLIIPLSGFGLAMGIAAVLGFTKGIEGVLWLIIGIFCTVWIAKKVPANHFLHGFVVGLIGGALAPLVEGIFFSRYVSHYPEFNDPGYQIPGGLEPRTFVFALAPISGLISGVVLGLLSWAADKLLNKTASTVSPR